MKKNMTDRMKKMTVLFAMISTAMFIFTGCENEDDKSPEVEQDIVELAQETPSLSTLVTAIQAAGLTNTLKSGGPFTVFAPTNAAFEALPDGVLEDLLANPTQLAEILQYHVVSGNILSSQLTDGDVSTLLTGATVSVQVSGGVRLNGDASVTDADNMASNGIVHLIDKVLLPPTEEPEEQTIAQIASETSDLSVLVQILSLPGFEDLLSAASDEDGTLTVFAPTNEAFEALLQALGKSSLSEIPSEVVKEIVQYHLLATEAFSGSLSSQDYPTLLEGESVSVTTGNPVMIDDAEVVVADVDAANGVVHIIDKVLLPSAYKAALGTVVEVPLFSNDFTTLVAALKKANLVSTLIEGGDFTVFAPTNAAFEAAGLTSLDELTAEDLTPVLLYHVVSGKIMSADLPSVPDGVVTTLNSEGFSKFYLSLGDEVYINGSSKVTAVDIEKENGVIHVIDRTLTPPSQTVVEIAAALASASEAPEFTTLVALLTDPAQSAVLDVLSDEEGNFTVFAPTDAAFAEISSVTSTLSDEQISDVLKYHVVAGRIFSTDLSDGITPNTLKGETLTINLSDDGVYLSDKDDENIDAKVIQVNIHGVNGVIHVIDKVLIPTL